MSVANFFFKRRVTLNFFNRGGQFIEDVMDQQMALYKETHPEIEFEINAVAGASHQEPIGQRCAQSAITTPAQVCPYQLAGFSGMLPLGQLPLESSTIGAVPTLTLAIGCLAFWPPPLA